MADTIPDRIEKQILLRAPRSRVWSALTDAREFNQWFRVTLAGEFRAGQRIAGPVTYPGYEYLTMEAWVERMEPEALFSFRWHPFAIERGVDYSKEPDHHRRVPARGGPGGNAAHRDRDRLPATPGGPARSSARGELRWLGHAAPEHRTACRRAPVTARLTRARSSPRWATRRGMALVRRLSTEGALSVTALTEGTRISRQAVTKHLGVLARAGLVESERHRPGAALGARARSDRRGPARPRADLARMG